jgi:hypothetical protein
MDEEDIPVNFHLSGEKQQLPANMVCLTKKLLWIIGF